MLRYGFQLLSVYICNDACGNAASETKIAMGSYALDVVENTFSFFPKLLLGFLDFFFFPLKMLVFKRAFGFPSL